MLNHRYQRATGPRRLLTFLACTLAAVTAARAAEPAPGGSIVYANTAGPSTLDPYLSGNTIEIEVVNQIYEGLVVLDEHYHPKPMLASKVEANGDATAFTFTLRHGVRFQNGKEFTAADAAASLRRYAKVSPNAAVLADVTSYDTPDPYTLVVHLRKTNAVFEDMLVTPIYPVLMLPAEEENKSAREVDVIGTGPFRLGEWVRDSHLVIRRNADYVPDDTQSGTDGYAGRKIVQVDSVRYNFVPEANARVAALRAGEADIAGIVPPELAKTLAGQSSLAAQTVFPGCMSVLILHSQNPPTDNPLVREAIAAVTNADDVIDAAGLVAKKNPSILYADSPYYDSQNGTPFYSQNNITRARELLSEAGYKGEKIVLQTNATYPAMRDSLLVLAEAMKAAGMNAEVQVLDWISNSNAMQRGTRNWNVTTSWFCSQPLLGPQQWRPIIYNYTAMTNNAPLDSDFTKFMTGLQVADRKSAWTDAERELLGKAYVIKISDFGWMYAYNRKIQGLQPWYSLRFWNVTAR